MYCGFVEVDPNIEASGLLDGLEGDDRAQRAELVHWLLGEGFSEADILASLSPLLLPARLHIGGSGRHVSTAEIAETTGLSIDMVHRAQRAVGLPTVEDADEPAYLESDAQVITQLAEFIELGIDPDEMLEATRTLAEGLSNAAALMRVVALSTAIRPGATELETAQASEALIAAAAPKVGPMVENMLMLQLRHALENEAVSAVERMSGNPLPGARRVAVGFADLVDFTRLGEAVEPEQLEKLAHRLATMARDVAQPPVLFIKTIGDAVMLVSPDPVPLLDAMLRLAGEAGADPAFPRLRSGIAIGDAVSRAGDWYGSPVNRASRVTAAARPGTVLITDPVRQAIGETAEFTFSYAGSRRLKGLPGDTRLYRAHRIA